MSAEIDRYQRLLDRHRRKPMYLTPHDFLAACIEYFEWCENTPLQEEQVWQYQGAVIRTDVAKTRPFTKKGLACYLGIPETRLNGYKARADEAWVEVAELVEQIIYNQKFEGAAAGLLNSSIISRDLGLAEKTESTASVQVADVSPADQVPDEHLAIHVHPDDPDPLNLPRPLFSRAQLDAGIQFPK